MGVNKEFSLNVGTGEVIQFEDGSIAFLDSNNGRADFNNDERVLIAKFLEGHKNILDEKIAFKARDSEGAVHEVFLNIKEARSMKSHLSRVLKEDVEDEL